MAIGGTVNYAVTRKKVWYILLWFLFLQFVCLIVPVYSEVKLQDQKCHLVCLGDSDYSSYCLCETERLKSGKAIVFSFGIGEDMSFDEAIISRYKIIVYGFDPTPKAIKFVNSKNVSNFNFTAEALCKDDKILYLYPPVNPDHVSMSTSKRTGIEPLAVDCISMLTAMKRINTHRIDVLKLDIEGGEYDLFFNASITKQIPRIHQILLEVHPNVDKELILYNLNAMGYVLTHNKGDVYSFRRKSHRSNHLKSDKKFPVNKKLYVESLNGNDISSAKVIQDIVLFHQTLPQGAWLFFQMINMHYIKMTNNWFDEPLTLTWKYHVNTYIYVVFQDMQYAFTWVS